MNIKGKHYRTVWVSGDGKAVEIIDQTKLPFKFEVVALTSAEMAATAIQEMWVRGAPLIGVVAAYGIALGMNHDASDMGLQRYYDLLIKTRPTAINLKWALDRMIDTLKDLCVSERKDVAWALAAEIAEEDVALCELCTTITGGWLAYFCCDRAEYGDGAGHDCLGSGKSLSL